MANDSKIVITAGLQIPETVSTVEKELKVVGEKVSADRALKIVANVDLSKTTQRIQSQLATLSKNLKLDINTVNVNSNVNAVVNGVQKELEKAGNAVSGTSKNVGTIATAYAEGAKQSEILHQKQERLQQDYDILVAKIQKTKLALDTLATRDGTNYNEVFTGIMSRQVVDEASLNRARDALSAIRKEFQLANAQMTSDIPQNAIENFIQRIAKADSQIKILAVDYQKLNNPPQALMDSFQKLQELAKGFNFSTDFKGESKESINARIQAYTQIKVALNETQSLLQSAQKEESLLAKEEENFAKKLEAHNREILNRINLKESEIQKERELSEAEARRIRETNEAEMDRYWQGRFEESVKGIAAENEELKKMRQYYADMAKEAQQKENAFNREFERELKAEEKLEAEQQKRLATARELREEQQHNYWQGRFEDSVKGLTAENSVLKEMRQYYEKLNKEAEKLNRTQSQDNNKALQEANKLIKDNLSALEKFNNSTVAKNNASNPAVASQTGLNADLINQLRGLQESLANDKSPENIARITARMNELGSSLRDAKFNSEALDQSLRDESSAAKLSANISKLTNQMNIFANTNRKATESLRLMRDGETTFAAKWQELTTAIRSGNLSAEDLRRLSDGFRVFRGEADAAGLTVSRFFQSMQSQLRMVLQRWISLYAVVGYIRKMIDNVKELDNAMINLRRVTNETDAGYQRFLEDANKLARQMKTTTASLVEMSYQWSKLGYEMNEALELSKASTIFMRVADVGQDQALSNLVTSLKAFRLEASQTMDVVDKLDKLNNEYAVSASGLGQGLERSASAMAMTGNSLEETLAMLTGAGEITQNLENTGRILPLENYIG